MECGLLFNLRKWLRVKGQGSRVKVRSTVVIEYKLKAVVDGDT